MADDVMGEDLGELVTERVDARYADLDRRPVLGVLEAMNDAEARVPAVVRTVLPQLAVLVEAVAERVRAGGRVLYVGAGTSGRMGVLDASECPPTFHVPPELFQGVMAGGRDAVFAAVEGAEDSEEAGGAAVRERGVGPTDTVVGIAASGRTPYVLGAVAAARAAGALTAGLANNPGSLLGAAVDHPLEVVVGPEVLAGSTRLTAGSAAKQVLNMLSTGVMVRVGKTYGNLMVDLHVTNAKLRDRAERLVARITGCDQATAAQALTAADDRIPVAALMVARELGRADAEAALAEADGRLAVALDAPA